MKVMFLDCVAGPNFVFYTNQIRDLPEEMAKNFIKAGTAVSLEPEAAALAYKAQTATLPQAKPRKRGD